VTVALELELHAKNMSRYEKIFAKYTAQNHLDLVWYFVRSRSFGASLKAKWKDVLRRKYVKNESLIFTVISDFEKNPRLAKIYFMSGKTNSVEEFFGLPVAKSPSPLPAQAVGGSSNEEKPDEALQIAS
jgi:hypothetical protein